MKEIIAINDGYLYNATTMELVAEITIGNRIAAPDNIIVFYGTQEEAIDFGIIFKDI